MSFVPAPQQAIAAANNAPSAVTPTAVAAAADPEAVDKDLLFKLRTFDVYWVDKTALMYKDGIDKVSFNASFAAGMPVLSNMPLTWSWPFSRHIGVSYQTWSRFP